MESRPLDAGKFVSIFSTGRPTLPWGIANTINLLMAEQNINSVGVTGSLCPSVLTAMGYGAPDREVNACACYSRWDKAIQLSYVIEDSPGMEQKHRYPDPYLPVKVRFPESPGSFFRSEAVFIDLPFSHRCVQLDPVFLEETTFKLIFLGFLENYDGPTDILEHVKSSGYELEEISEKVAYVEKKEELLYRLIIAKGRSSVA